MAGPVVLTLDTSELSLVAAPYAAGLAAALGLPLVLLGVWDGTDQDIGGRLAGMRNEEMEPVAIGAYRTALEAARADLTSPEATIEVRKGRPADEIIDFAAAVDASFVVLASHGRGGLSRLVFGSVADRVVRAAPVPVLVVRANAPSHEPFAPKRVLLPLDGSPAAEGAIPLARVVASAFGATLVAVRVVPAATTPFMDLPPVAVDQVRAELTADAKAYLEGLALEGAELRVVEGDAARTLAGEVDATGADLVVMTSHGRSGLTRWALGSVADRLLQSTDAPVILVPQRG